MRDHLKSDVMTVPSSTATRPPTTGTPLWRRPLGFRARVAGRSAPRVGLVRDLQGVRALIATLRGSDAAVGSSGLALRQLLERPMEPGGLRSVVLRAGDYGFTMGWPIAASHMLLPDANAARAEAHSALGARRAMCSVKTPRRVRQLAYRPGVRPPGCIRSLGDFDPTSAVVLKGAELHIAGERAQRAARRAANE